MRIYSRKALHWEGYDLMLEDRKMSGIYQKDDDPRFYQVEYSDGVLSADYYNKQRAKEHAVRIALEELNLTDEETGVAGPQSDLN